MYLPYKTPGIESMYGLINWLPIGLLLAMLLCTKISAINLVKAMFFITKKTGCKNKMWYTGNNLYIPYLLH